MRKLQTQDVFKMARIIKQANIKEMVRDAIHNGQKIGANKNLTDAEREETQNEIGVDVFMGLLDSCGDQKVEALLYEFLGGVFELSSAEDVGKMSLDALVDNIGRLIKENNITAFFKAAGQLRLK